MLSTTLRLLMLARLPSAGRMPLLYARVMTVLLVEDALRCRWRVPMPSAISTRSLVVYFFML